MARPQKLSVTSLSRDATTNSSTHAHLRRGVDAISLPPTAFVSQRGVAGGIVADATPRVWLVRRLGLDHLSRCLPEDLGRRG